MSQTPPFQDPFEFLRKMWSPMGLPMPGITAPLLDPNEIDKRISDLKSVEGWLSTNLSMLRMSIQALEMQKATLGVFQAMSSSAGAAQQSMAESTSAAGAGATNAATSAAEAWWNMLQQAQSEPPKAPEPPPKK